MSRQDGVTQSTMTAIVEQITEKMEPYRSIPSMFIIAEIETQMMNRGLSREEKNEIGTAVGINLGIY